MLGNGRCTKHRLLEKLFAEMRLGTCIHRRKVVCSGREVDGSKFPGAARRTLLGLHPIVFSNFACKALATRTCTSHTPVAFSLRRLVVRIGTYRFWCSQLLAPHTTKRIQHIKDRGERTCVPSVRMLASIGTRSQHIGW